MDSIIQWNCRGFRANFDEIGCMVQDLNPSVFCLQETFLKPPNSFKLRNYHMYNTYGNIAHDRATGGSSILVKNGIIHTHIALNTNLQATAVRLNLNKTFTICSLYIPPPFHLTASDLHNLYNQLPEPRLILGDFNSHNQLWGSTSHNNKGKTIEDFLNDHTLCLFNDGSPTYLHPGHGTFSAIDLSICDPALFLEFEWRVLEDTHGSDHFPIVLQNVEGTREVGQLRWKLHKADWTSFEKHCLETITMSHYRNCNNLVEDFTDDITDIANKTIPMTKNNSKRSARPWFDDEVREAIKNRKKALRIFKSQPTINNLNNFKCLKAKARRIVRQKKRSCWRDYVSRLTERTPSNKVWKMIKKIEGKNLASHVSILEVNGEHLSSPEQISNGLGEQFAYNSSSENYTREFQCYKAQAERLTLNIQSDNSEDYNSYITLEELQKAILKATDSATGPDNIHYQILKHLPQSSLKTLLYIFNQIWEKGCLPSLWKQATVIPIPKPGKDHSDPMNYRPIALTSCLCKTMERIVTDRLVWFLESNQLITEFQSGFRRHRSTLDHLVRLETYVRDAFINREHVVAIFFDLEKAYDTTWKYGIMKDLHDLGLRGRLPVFIGSFLQDRFFKVRVGSTMSSPYSQENGVPQGSILSPTLFNVKINSIVNSISENLMSSLYVDDFLIAYRSRYMPTIERQLQLNLNRIHKWSLENGFKFSKQKTVCLPFYYLRSNHPDPSLIIDNCQIKVVNETKFLGVLFDSKLSFIPHIKALKAKCLKSMNLLKVVSKYNWGGDTTVLLRLYRAITRSRLDYGSVVYGSARPSYLKCLNSVHHQGLRLSLRAFRTSPVESLYVLAGEPPLSLRRIKLSMQYILKVASTPTNPTYDVIFHPKYMHHYESRSNAIRPLGLRMKFYLEAAKIDTTIIAETEVPPIPPWILPVPKVILDLAELKKSETNPVDYQNLFYSIRFKYESYKFLYTDGSKMERRVGCAVTSYKTVIAECRLPDHCSIYTAELTAIYLALKNIEDSESDRYVICSDSKSALQAIQNKQLDNPGILDVLIKYFYLHEYKDIVFCWIPGHAGIEGNEKADLAAKRALTKEITDFTIPYTDFKMTIKSFIMSCWQRQWNECNNNKLHSILPCIQNKIPSRFNTRKDQGIYHRCLIGHSRLTHLHLLVNEPAPVCQSCRCPLTIKHILLDCSHLQRFRRPLFQANTLQHLFTRYPTQTIIDFLYASGFYYQI